jgi:hypothetical protein
MIDLDSPPPCPVCGTIVLVHEWRDGDYDYGWWWSCPDAGCPADGRELVDVRPTYRTFPATAALAEEVLMLRERLAARGDRVA